MKLTTEFPQDVIDAATRVGKIFAGGCDRCNGRDLELLEQAGLMKHEICRDTFGHDTLEIGEPMWTFNAKGEELLKAIEAGRAALTKGTPHG